MIIQFLLMVILAFFIAKAISTRSVDNAKQHLSAVTDERAQIVIDHVETAETLLEGFAKSPSVEQFLKDPTNKELQEEAQTYAEKYSESIPGLEGLYVANMKSETLAHSNPASVGVVSREGSRLVSLQEDLNRAQDKVNVEGIMISPADKKTPIVSMQRAVFDPTNDRMIGYVGLAIKTEDLVKKLENMKTQGLEQSFYSMIDVKKRVYVFDENMENANQNLELPDLIRQCDIYENATETESTTYEFELPTGKFVGASYYIPKYHWLLMMNDARSEVYTLAYAMRMFFIVFEILIIAVMIIFSYLNRKQEKVNQKLLSSVETVNETKKSLNTAMFGDILTGAGNRVKLATELTGITDAKANPYYFALFNIMEFSNINTAYGSDTGDSLLVRTAETLKETIPNGEVYRTGSDEFVVVIKSENGAPRVSDVLFSVDEALKKLLVPENVRGLGTLYPKYKVAAIKKNTDIDASVITILKEMTNVKGEAMCGMIDFVDMTE